MGTEVLDIVFRRPGEFIGYLDLISSPDVDPLIYGGSAAATDGSSGVQFRIEVAQQDLNATQDALVQTSDSEWALLLEDGAPSGYGVSSYSTTSLIDESWQLHSGTFRDVEGDTIDFFAVTDPVPAVVWIAGIAVVGCLLKVGIDALLLNCQGAVSADIQACANQGGLPSLTVATTYGFGRVGGQVQVGCSATCVVECRPAH
jgi:hypothetical protein